MAMKIEANTAYTLEEIKDGLQVVGVHTLRRWIRKKKLRATKMGRAYVVLGQDLLRTIEADRTREPGELI